MTEREPPPEFPYPGWKKAAEYFKRFTDWHTRHVPFSADPDHVEFTQQPKGLAMSISLAGKAFTGCDGVTWNAAGQYATPAATTLRVCYLPLPIWEQARGHGGIDPDEGIAIFVGDCPTLLNQAVADMQFGWPPDAVKVLAHGDTFSISSLADPVFGDNNKDIVIDCGPTATWTVAATVGAPAISPASGTGPATVSIQPLVLFEDWTILVTNTHATEEIIVATPQCVELDNDTLGLSGADPLCPGVTCPKICVDFVAVDGAKILECELFAPECPQFCDSTYTFTGSADLNLCDDPSCLSFTTPGISVTRSISGASDIYRIATPDAGGVATFGSLTVSNDGPACIFVAHNRWDGTSNIQADTRLLPGESVSNPVQTRDFAGNLLIVASVTCDVCRCHWQIEAASGAPTIPTADGEGGATVALENSGLPWGVNVLNKGQCSVSVKTHNTGVVPLNVNGVAIQPDGFSAPVIVAPAGSTPVVLDSADDLDIVIECAMAWTLTEVSGIPTTDIVPAGDRPATITVRSTGTSWSVKLNNTGSIPITANTIPIAPNASALFHQASGDLPIVIACG